MKKIIIILLVALLITGCQGKSKEESNKDLEENKQEESVVKDQIFTGLEFVTINISGTAITTRVVNNTGVTYEPSTFKIVVKDKEGNVIDTVIGNIEQAIKTGDSKTITSSANVDLSNAYRVQYSVN